MTDAQLLNEPRFSKQTESESSNTNSSQLRHKRGSAVPSSSSCTLFAHRRCSSCTMRTNTLASWKGRMAGTKSSRLHSWTLRAPVRGGGGAPRCEQEPAARARRAGRAGRAGREGAQRESKEEQGEYGRRQEGRRQCSEAANTQRARSHKSSINRHYVMRPDGWWQTRGHCEFSNTSL